MDVRFLKVRCLALNGNQLANPLLGFPGWTHVHIYDQMIDSAGFPSDVEYQDTLISLKGNIFQASSVGRSNSPKTSTLCPHMVRVRGRLAGSGRPRTSSSAPFRGPGSPVQQKTRYRCYGHRSKKGKGRRSPQSIPKERNQAVDPFPHGNCTKQAPFIRTS